MYIDLCRYSYLRYGNNALLSNSISRKKWEFNCCKRSEPKISGKIGTFSWTLPKLKRIYIIYFQHVQGQNIYFQKVPATLPPQNQIAVNSCQNKSIECIGKMIIFFCYRSIRLKYFRPKKIIVYCAFLHIVWLTR